ncbi:MAG: type II secretion system F family protein, partial [Thermodesulfobacteriota bacterium]
MPVYSWQGKTIRGEVKKGEVEAGNLALATALLRRQKIIPLKVKEKKKGIEINIFGPKKVQTKDIVIFTRQFATMIDAGLPLVQCLDILASQQPNKAFKDAISDVKADVEGGLTFAEALKKHPKLFSALYYNLVAAGEAGGVLDTILNRLAIFMEKAMKLKSTIKSALVYPVCIVSIAIIVITLLLVFVIPQFESMFQDFGADLPAPTRFVMNLSEWFKHNIIYMFLGLVGFIIAFSRFYKTAKGRRIVDAVLLKSPVIGELVKKIAVARFTRTLGTMLTSGVPILDALDIVSKTAGNKVVEEAIMKARVSISEGKTIAEPLAETKIFPPM